MKSNTDLRPNKAWVITGPTSGIGHRTALKLAEHGVVVLVGRDAKKLAAVQSEINRRPGGQAVTVIADMSDPSSARAAAEEITALNLPVAGILNNAGIMPLGAAKTKQGLDLAFATNHLGPFAFTDALIPHLGDGTIIVFVTSAVEDPERKPAATAGFRGGRFISVQASAQGQWKAGGSKKPGYDAYATSKQCNLATVLAFARETPRLRFRAIEPGLNPGTGLGRDAGAALRTVAKLIAPLGAVVPNWSTPKRAASVITRILTDNSDATGTYYNENGKAMRPSTEVSDAAFSDRVVAETREFLRTS
jgi:NAD(P)-dependent dehydrogenase (short-subunit alcohol dehydrogenase family)